MIKIVPIGTSAFIAAGKNERRIVRILGRLGEGVKEEVFNFANVRLDSKWSGNRITASVKCKNSVFISFVKLELRFRTPQRSSLLSTWTESYCGAENIPSVKKCPGTLSRTAKREGAWAMWISESCNSDGMMFFQIPPVEYPVLFSCSRTARTLAIKWVLNRSFQKDEILSLPRVDILRGGAQQLINQWRGLWKSLLDRKLAPAIGSSWCTNEETQSPEQIQLSLASLKNFDFPVDCFSLGPNYVSVVGDWLEPGELFREKMGLITRSISESRMIPGIRFAPFLVSRKSSLAASHPEWLLRTDKWRPLKVKHYGNEAVYVLDVTKPEVLNHIRKVLKVMHDRWGFQAFIVERMSDVAVRGVRENTRISPGHLINIAAKTMRNALGGRIFMTAGDIPLLCAIDTFNARVTAANFSLENSPDSQNNLKKILINTIVTLHRSEWANVGWFNTSGLLPVNLLDAREKNAIHSLVKAIQLSCRHILLSGNLDELSPDSMEKLVSLLGQVARRREGKIRQLSYCDCLDKKPLIMRNNQGSIGVFNLSNRIKKAVLNKEAIKRNLNVPSNLKINDAAVLNSPEIHVSIPPLGSRIFTL